MTIVRRQPTKMTLCEQLDMALVTPVAYYIDMTIATDFIPMRRESDQATRSWGLYSVSEDRWLDLVFAARRDADEACAVLKGATLRAGQEAQEASRISRMAR